MEDQWVTPAKCFGEQVACELNDDISRIAATSNVGPEPSVDAGVFWEVPVAHSARFGPVEEFTQPHRRELRARSIAKTSERGEMDVRQGRRLQCATLKPTSQRRMPRSTPRSATISRRASTCSFETFVLHRLHSTIHTTSKPT